MGWRFAVARRGTGPPRERPIAPRTERELVIDWFPGRAHQTAGERCCGAGGRGGGCGFAAGSRLGSRWTVASSLDWAARSSAICSALVRNRCGLGRGVGLVMVLVAPAPAGRARRARRRPTGTPTVARRSLDTFPVAWSARVDPWRRPQPRSFQSSNYGWCGVPARGTQSTARLAFDSPRRRCERTGMLRSDFGERPRSGADRFQTATRSHPADSRT